MRLIRHFFNVRLGSWRGVAAYTLVIAVVAIIASMLILRGLSGPGLLPWDYGRAAIIAALIAPPFGIFGGWQRLRVTKLSDELARLVARDRLTDVATRDFFFERMKEAPDAFGVSLMVDIDHFKAVNDTYGHLAGDHVIAAVAEVMRKQVRPEDVVCRFGGEEFVIFLMNASREDGARIAERIRAETEATLVETQAGPVKVTVSVGGSLKEQLDALEDAIRRADECLYKAKALGRNRSVFDWHGVPFDKAS